MESKTHRKSRSISRQCSKDKLSKNHSAKFTPKSLLKTSGYTDGEQNGNLRTSKSYKRGESPALLALRTSRSNSSRKNKLSSKKGSTKKPKSKIRSNASKNSSRRALGFESVESSKSPDNKIIGADYLLNKYEKLVKARKGSKRKNKRKSPEISSRNGNQQMNTNTKKVCKLV